MPESLDQIGNRLRFEQTPKRIVSLVPSQSEFLWDLGLREELVGITKFCIHPGEMFKTVKRVGGTKNVDLDAIRAVKPDLIVGNKEENVKEQIEELSREFPVWMSDVNTPEDALNMMKSLGELLGKEKEASQILNQVNVSLEKSRNIFKGERVAYFIWNEPYHFAASKTFIHEVLKHAGLVNVLANLDRYPELELVELRKLKPRFCFLSSEPFPFKHKQAEEIGAQLPDSRMVFSDGEMISWYGSRLIYLYDYLLRLKKEMYA